MRACGVRLLKTKQPLCSERSHRSQNVKQIQAFNQVSTRSDPEFDICYADTLSKISQQEVDWVMAMLAEILPAIAKAEEEAAVEAEAAAE